MNATISICESVGCVNMAVFHDFDIIRDFKTYPDEKSALEAANQWCQENGHEVERVVHPTITKETNTFIRVTRKKT